MPLPDIVQPLPPETDRFFLPALTFVDHRDDALPGAIKPRFTKPLFFEGERITPLLPFHPDLLACVTPAELGRCTQFEPLNDKAAPQLKVTVNLGAPHNRTLSKTYTLTKEQVIENLPILEVWPNFRSENWQLYYGFYYDAELENTFRVRFPEQEEKQEMIDARGGRHQISRMEQFPSVVECLNLQQEVIGLILLRQPPELSPFVNWTVGVDFGSLFTNLYIQRKKDVIEHFPINSDLLHKIVESNSNVRLLELLEYFIPERFLPIEQPLPIANVLTRRGSPQSNLERPLFDGRIFVPDARSDHREDYLDRDINFFSDRPTQKLFLKNLVLLISAIAAANQVRQIQWSISYPATASRRQIEDYYTLWQQIIQEFATQTGINHILPLRSPASPESRYFRSNTLAFAQYVADEAEQDLVSTTCIHIERPFTEIAIWQDNKLLHRCTFQFTEVELLHQFLERRPQFLEKLDFRLQEWQLKGGAFSDRLALWKRWENEEWLELKRPSLTNDPEFQGLIQLIAIGLSGLYYYIGIMLKVLHNEAKYQRPIATPVYIGGSGTFLLNWLDSAGHFNEHSEINALLSEMLRLGSGFPSRSTIGTEISKHPKDEVAWGLVLAKTQLKEPQHPHPLIFGEDCELNGQRFSWDTSRLPETPQSFRIPDPKRLQQFLRDFDKALKTLRIETIRPLQYQSNPSIFNPNLWKGTQPSLEKILQENISQNKNLNQVDPPFILGLKALLTHLGREWSKS